MQVIVRHQNQAHSASITSAYQSFWCSEGVRAAIAGPLRGRVARHIRAFPTREDVPTTFHWGSDLSQSHQAYETNKNSEVRTHWFLVHSLWTMRVSQASAGCGMCGRP